MAQAISTGTPDVVGGSVGASVDVVLVEVGAAVVVVVDVVVVGVVVVVVVEVVVVVVDVVVVLVVVVVGVVVEVVVEVVVDDAARSFAFFFFPRCHWPAHLVVSSPVASVAVEDSPVASTIAAPSIK